MYPSIKNANSLPTKDSLVVFVTSTMLFFMFYSSMMLIKEQCSKSDFMLSKKAKESSLVKSNLTMFSFNLETFETPLEEESSCINSSMFIY